MIFKKVVLSFFFLLAVNFQFFAQSNLLNAKSVDKIDFQSKNFKKETIDKPLPYGYTSDRDILWSTTVWETIDLNEKINHPLYFPTDSLLGSKRMSLYNTLNKAFQSKKSYEVYETSYLINKKNKSAVDSVLSYKCISNNTTTTLTVKPKDITQFQIKGIWYFDKLQSELKYRLIAIAPMVSKGAKRLCDELNQKEKIRKQNREKKGKQKKKFKSGQVDPIPLYWAYYPELRNILHKSKVFNPDNSIQSVSFDQVLNSRRFSSIIVKEQNVYGDRAINEYEKNSTFRLLEAQRIKESIRNKEIDMWNY